MSDQPPSLRSPNVYMTGHTKDDASIVLPKKDLRWTTRDEGKVALANVFTTNENPIDFQDRKDITLSDQVLASGKLSLVHPYGAVIRYFDVAPGNSEKMHQTLSIDFAICIEGRMELKLDSEETRIMKPGDIVIQRGTMHSWKNASKTEWCRLVAVMMPAKEFSVRGEEIEESSR